jgi:hypothetical protein
LHGPHPFFAAQGLHGLHGPQPFFAAQGLHGLHGRHAASWMVAGFGLATGSGFIRSADEPAEYPGALGATAPPTTTPAPTSTGINVLERSFNFIDLTTWPPLASLFVVGNPRIRSPKNARILPQGPVNRLHMIVMCRRVRARSIGPMVAGVVSRGPRGRPPHIVAGGTPPLSPPGGRGGVPRTSLPGGHPP